MSCVSECVVVCRCFDMQSKSPAPECNVSLVGSHQARAVAYPGGKLRVLEHPPKPSEAY